MNLPNQTVLITNYCCKWTKARICRWPRRSSNLLVSVCLVGRLVFFVKQGSRNRNFVHNLPLFIATPFSISSKGLYRTFVFQKIWRHCWKLLSIALRLHFLLVNPCLLLERLFDSRQLCHHQSLLFIWFTSFESDMSPNLNYNFDRGDRSTLNCCKPKPPHTR